MKALVTGATGFIGKNLIQNLNDPHVLSRRPKEAEAEIPQEALNGVDSAPDSGFLQCRRSESVTNRDLTSALGRALHRPTIFPAPGAALRIALGEFAMVLLSSQRVEPKRLVDEGYPFLFPDLDQALLEIVNPPSDLAKSAS
jgi:NAD dependent epimerase/dehydratase family enzyme